MLAQVQGAEVAPQSIPDTDEYLTHEDGGHVYASIAVGHGLFGGDYGVRRARDSVWATVAHGGFNATVSTSAVEARRIGEAWLKAAEDAEEFARQLQAEEDYQIELERQREHEMHMAMEAEARGEEYIPSAIGAEHMHAIEVAMLFGGELRPWQEDLKPKVIYSENANGAAAHVELVGCEATASWRLRHSAAHPLVYQIVASHAPTAMSGLRTAVPDDFGTLTRVPADLLAIVAPLPEQVSA